MAARRKKRAKPRLRKKNPPEPSFGDWMSGRLKGAADKVLEAVERDPERALDQLGTIGLALKAAHQAYKENPKEVNRVIKNTAITQIAKALRRGL